METDKDDPISEAMNDGLNEKRGKLVLEFIQLNDDKFSAKDIASWVGAFMSTTAALLTIGCEEHPQYKDQWIGLLRSSLYLLKKLEANDFKNN